MIGFNRRYLDKHKRTTHITHTNRIPMTLSGSDGDTRGEQMMTTQNVRDVAHVIGTAGMVLCRDAHGAFDHSSAFYETALESFLEVFVADGGTDDMFLCEAFAWIDNAPSWDNRSDDIFGLVAFCAVIIRYGPHVAMAMAYGHPDVMHALIETDAPFEQAAIDIAESMRPIGGTHVDN